MNTNKNMTKIETELESKKNAVVGTLNQAKGVARETLGKATNNQTMQLKGKKDQIVGTLQKTAGDSWAFRHKNLLVGLTTALAVVGAVVYYLGRDLATNAENTYETTYSH